MQIYIRFQTDLRGAGDGRRLGIFTSAGCVKSRRDLDPAMRLSLNEAMAWFNENLDAPSDEQIDERCIFWFRSTAQSMLSHIWDLAWLLNEEGAHVRWIRTKRPGRIIYSDEHQVAAIPHGVRRFRRGGKRIRREKIYGR